MLLQRRFTEYPYLFCDMYGCPYRYEDDKMKIRNFIYYGYSREDYLTCSSLILSNNYETTKLVTFWSFLIFCVLSILSFFLSITSSFQSIYTSFAAVTGILFLCFFLFPDFSQKHPLFFSYLQIIVLFSFGIASTVPFSKERATVYPVMLVFLPVLFLDNMIRMSTVLSVMSALFCIISFQVKTPRIFSADIYNAIVLTFVAVLIHYIIQNRKLNSLIHVRDTQILIRKYQAAQNELEIKATFDSLSGLYNRSNFISEADRVLFECSSCNHFIALCILDIDQFKSINDTYGHQAGDAAIRITAQKAEEILHVIHLEEDYCCKEDSETACFQNIAGRLGGDEFIFLIMTAEDEASVIRLMKDLLTELNHASAGPVKTLEASIGMTIVTEIPSGFDLLYSQADAALYFAKKSGRNQICVYREDMS